MIRRPPRSTQGYSSAASDVYKRQEQSGARERVRPEPGRCAERGGACEAREGPAWRARARAAKEQRKKKGEGRREKRKWRKKKRKERGKGKKKENRKWKKGSKNGKKKKGRGRGGVSALRRRPRPWSATRGVGHARAGQGASAAGCAGQGAKARAAGANCGRLSRVGDRRPCDAGWDGGEDKEKRVRSAGNKNGTTIGTGRRKKNLGGKIGFRVNRAQR